MTNTREEVAVTKAIETAFLLHPYAELADMDSLFEMSGDVAKAAIASTNSKYVAGLVEALKFYREQEWLGGEDGVAAQALNNLPEELRG